MTRADAYHTTNLSSLIRDPFVRAAFEAAERDGLAPPAVLVETSPSLDGGQAVAFGDLRLTGWAAAQCEAFLQQSRAGGTMDSPVYASAALQ